MKTKIFNCLIVALCTMSFAGCEKKNEDFVGLPSPSIFEIVGTITNDEGQPIEDIQVLIDSATIQNLHLDEYWSYSGHNSNKKGVYFMRYAYRWRTLSTEKWPSDIILTAKDTTGIYETQVQVCPVEVRVRFPEDTLLHNYTDGIVTADFVMKKK